MKKFVLGYIFLGKNLGDDEKIFLKLAKRKNMEIVLFDISADIGEEELAEKVKRCDLIYNSNANLFALEFAKTVEGFGKKVIDSPKAYYYVEDKWLFFVKCKKHGIPTPETILLSNNLTIAKGEFGRFNHWPLILKMVSGCQGEFVWRAENQKEAIEIIKKAWDGESEMQPIIAQEFIKSDTYRVLVFGSRIVQTVLKKSRGWKATGAWAYRHKRFKPNKGLREIVGKITKIAGIKICGIDLVKKDGKWVVLEVNSEPTFGFIGCDREKLVGKALNFLKTCA